VVVGAPEERGAAGGAEAAVAGRGGGVFGVGGGVGWGGGGKEGGGGGEGPGDGVCWGVLGLWDGDSWGSRFLL